MTPRRVVVSGAGGGLGRQIAVRLAEAGYAVHVTDVDEQAARAVSGGTPRFET